MIRLHPTPEGYQLVAKITAEALAKELGLQDLQAPKPLPGAGVRVVNLWQGDSAGKTAEPVIAGWYTLSFDVAGVDAAGGSVAVAGIAAKEKGDVTVAPADAGKRLSLNFFTGYEGYGYTRAALTLAVQGCRIERILLEKTRPSQKPSIYGEGSYLDTQTPPAGGELVALE